MTRRKRRDIDEREPPPKDLDTNPAKYAWSKEGFYKQEKMVRRFGTWENYMETLILPMQRAADLQKESDSGGKPHYVDVLRIAKRVALSLAPEDQPKKLIRKIDETDQLSKLDDESCNKTKPKRGGSKR